MLNYKPFLSQCVSKITKDKGKCERFQYAVASCQGWRTSQEDAHLALVDLERNTSMFGVFDGHNGPEVAQFVALCLPNCLRKNVNYRQGNVERGMQEAFMALDELLLTRDANNIMLGYRDANNKNNVNACDTRPPNEGLKKEILLAHITGCTAVVLLIKNDIYYCANIGDSRCIVCRNGKAIQLSKDHKPTDDEERVRITRAGGEVINGRVNRGIDVSRSFGDHHYKRNPKLNKKQQMLIAWPHTHVEKIDINDQFILLICDGIWNAIDNQTLVEFVQKRLALRDTLIQICEAVIQKILPKDQIPTKGLAGKDNMTIMIIKKTQPSDNVNALSLLSMQSLTPGSSVSSSSSNNTQQQQQQQQLQQQLANNNNTTNTNTNNKSFGRESRLRVRRHKGSKGLVPIKGSGVASIGTINKSPRYSSNLGDKKKKLADGGGAKDNYEHLGTLERIQALTILPLQPVGGLAPGIGIYVQQQHQQQQQQHQHQPQQQQQQQTSPHHQTTPTNQHNQNNLINNQIINNSPTLPQLRQRSPGVVLPKRNKDSESKKSRKFNRKLQE